MRLFFWIYDNLILRLNHWSNDRCLERGVIIEETLQARRIRLALWTLNEYDFREDELSDRSWRDDLTEAEIVKGIEDHYGGGWKQFLVDEELEYQ